MTIKRFGDLPHKFAQDISNIFPEGLPKLFDIGLTNETRVVSTKFDGTQLVNVVLLIEGGSKTREIDLRRYFQVCSKNSLRRQHRHRKVRKQFLLKFQSTKRRNRCSTISDAMVHNDKNPILIEELRHRVRHAIRALSPKLSEAAWLHWIEQYNPDEIASILDVTPKAIYDRLHRAKAQLSDLLSDLDPRRN